ncbi:tape measure protein, partial [uncultured Lamprocystis sp.]
MANDLELKLTIRADGSVAVGQLQQVGHAAAALGPAATAGAGAAERALTGLERAANGGLGQMVRLNEGLELLGRAQDLVAPLAAIADEWNNLQARLRLVTDSTAAYGEALAAVRAIADDTRSDVAATAELYTTLQRALTSLGDTQTNVTDLTRTISQAMQLSGASAAASEGALRQLAQALSSGVLRGDEFNSVMEQAPRLQQALADALGVTSGQLRAMAGDGQLSAETVIGALAGQSERIAAEYATLPETIAGAGTRLRNAIAGLVGDLDDSTGASAGLAAALGLVADHLDSLVGLAGGAALGGLAAGAV